MTQFTQYRSSSTRLCLALAATTSLVAGCSMFRAGDEAAESVSAAPPTTRETYRSAQNVPQSLQPMNRPVVQGPLPLIYLTESEGTIRVTNVDSGEEIIAFPVKTSQIVRVEPRGVMLANKPVIGAALAPGTYAIAIGHEDAGVVRSTQTITRAVPASATKPAARPAQANPPLDSPTRMQSPTVAPATVPPSGAPQSVPPAVPPTQ